jgi:hypothetical protein
MMDNHNDIWNRAFRFGQISAKVEALSIIGNTLTVAEWIEYWDASGENYLVQVDFGDLLPSKDVALSAMGALIVDSVRGCANASGHAFGLMLKSDYLVSQHGTDNPALIGREAIHEAV